MLKIFLWIIGIEAAALALSIAIPILCFAAKKCNMGIFL